MQITEQRVGQVVVVSPHGRVDSNTSPVLDRHLRDLIATGTRQLAVDFGDVDYISSACLRVMLGVLRRLRDLGGALMLCGLAEPVQQVFDLAGLAPLFTIVDSTADAIARLPGA